MRKNYLLMEKKNKNKKYNEKNIKIAKYPKFKLR